MTTVAATGILAAWECGSAASAGERALLLLAAARPDLPGDALRRLPVGSRDRALLALRERLFGSHLTGLVACPECASTVEVELPVAHLASAAGPTPSTMVLERDGFQLTFRVPDAGDMVALGRAPAGVDERWLLDRCLLAARHASDESCAAVDLPAEVVGAVAEAMAAADPQADVELSLACPECGHAWTALFDIVSFLWRELDSWAGRLLRDVATLASAYGWSERDILGLSPWRRGQYVGLATR